MIGQIRIGYKTRTGFNETKKTKSGSLELLILSSNPDSSFKIVRFLGLSVFPKN